MFNIWHLLRQACTPTVGFYILAQWRDPKDGFPTIDHHVPVQ